METKTCPECLSEIPGPAQVCSQCGERIDGVRCEECQAMSPAEARKCRWCGNRLRQAAQQHLEAFRVQASRLGTLLVRMSLFPQEARFSAEKIVIRSYGFLGLTSSDEEIPWEKVAGFAHRNGIIWDLVAIETRGQTQAVITCLTKEDSLRIREVLQGLEK